MKLSENGNFHLFAANGKWKWQTSICMVQIEMGNGSLFSPVGKQKTVIDDFCFSKCSYLLVCCKPPPPTWADVIRGKNINGGRVKSGRCERKLRGKLELKGNKNAGLGKKKS
jgi:hypothetical protein